MYCLVRSFNLSIQILHEKRDNHIVPLFYTLKIQRKIILIAITFFVIVIANNCLLKFSFIAASFNTKIL